MAEPYLSDLRVLAEDWRSAGDRLGALECRHFFSGAAVYRDGAIVASLTPVGLAFKVPDDVRDRLLDSGRAAPLRYFPEAPIKQHYVLFADPGAIDATDAANLLAGKPI